MDKINKRIGLIIYNIFFKNILLSLLWELNKGIKKYEACRLRSSSWTNLMLINSQIIEI